MTTTTDFKSGDRVRHVPTQSDGVVTAVDQQGVHVSFDRTGTLGIYDDLWFRMHPGWLVQNAEDRADR
jgi:hypothetical protein